MTEAVRGWRASSLGPESQSHLRALLCGAHSVPHLGRVQIRHPPPRSPAFCPEVWTARAPQSQEEDGQQNTSSHTCDMSQPEHTPRHPGSIKDKWQPPKFSPSPKSGPGRGLRPARPGSHPQTVAGLGFEEAALDGLSGKQLSAQEALSGPGHLGAGTCHLRTERRQQCLWPLRPLSSLSRKSRQPLSLKRVVGLGAGVQSGWPRAGSGWLGSLRLRLPGWRESRGRKCCQGTWPWKAGEAERQPRGRGPGGRG